MDKNLNSKLKFGAGIIERWLNTNPFFYCGFCTHLINVSVYFRVVELRVLNIIDSRLEELFILRHLVIFLFKKMCSWQANKCSQLFLHKKCAFDDVTE